MTYLVDYLSKFFPYLVLPNYQIDSLTQVGLKSPKNIKVPVRNEIWNEGKESVKEKSKKKKIPYKKS